MTTIINTPPSVSESTDSGVGLVLGVIIAIVFIAIFFVYALPEIRSVDTTTVPKTENVNVNIKLPARDVTLTP